MAKTLELISYENVNSELVGKIDIPDLQSKSAIIVNESQEALFYKDGQALDLFVSGRHEITTDSLPLFKRIFNHLFGTVSALPCTVYFVNKVNVMNMNWGTPSAITLEDPKYKLVVNVGANGSMGVKVVDSRKFVVKIVGQAVSFSVEDVKRALKGVMMAYIKECIANVIIKEGVSILEIQTRLLDLSGKIQKAINDVIIQELGVELVNFYLNTIAADDNDLATLKQTKEKYMSAMTDIDIEAIKTVRMGQAQAESRAVQGFTYQEERKFDVLEGAAKNEGVSGTIMGAGIGLGAGVGVGNRIGSATSQVTDALNLETGKKCAKCGAILPHSSKFCPSCGEKVLEANRFCPNCGSGVVIGSKFCPNCGTKIGE